MTEDHRTQQLRLLANVVIDAYLNRDQQFIPEFESGTQAVMYLCRPEADKDHPGLRPNVFYERADYEPTVTSSEQETKDRRRKK